VKISVRAECRPVLTFSTNGELAGAMNAIFDELRATLDGVRERRAADPPALDVIAALPRYPGCSWLVPNPDTREPFDNVKNGWASARKAAGLPTLRSHDLRHSAASFMANSGVDLYAIGKILGHADHQSTMRYSHLANDTLLAAVEAGAAKMNI